MRPSSASRTRSQVWPSLTAAAWSSKRSRTIPASEFSFDVAVDAVALEQRQDLLLERVAGPRLLRGSRPGRAAASRVPRAPAPSISSLRVFIVVNDSLRWPGGASARIMHGPDGGASRGRRGLADRENGGESGVLLDPDGGSESRRFSEATRWPAASDTTIGAGSVCVSCRRRSGSIAFASHLKPQGRPCPRLSQMSTRGVSQL